MTGVGDEALCEEVRWHVTWCSAPWPAPSSLPCPEPALHSTAHLAHHCIHPPVVKASRAEPSAFALARSVDRLPVILASPLNPNQSSARMPKRGTENAAMAPVDSGSWRRCGKCQLLGGKQFVLHCGMRDCGAASRLPAAQHSMQAVLQPALCPPHLQSSCAKHGGQGRDRRECSSGCRHSHPSRHTALPHWLAGLCPNRTATMYLAATPTRPPTGRKRTPGCAAPAAQSRQTPGCCSRALRGRQQQSMREVRRHVDTCCCLHTTTCRKLHKAALPIMQCVAGSAHPAMP